VVGNDSKPPLERLRVDLCLVTVLLLLALFFALLQMWWLRFYANKKRGWVCARARVRACVRARALYIYIYILVSDVHTKVKLYNQIYLKAPFFNSRLYAPRLRLTRARSVKN
jgi:hypothetical protein